MSVSRDVINQSFWALPTEDVLILLETRSSGLLDGEPADRRAIFGPNVIEKKKRLIGLKIFFRQFKSPLIFILVIAGFMTAFLNRPKDAVFIFIAVVINSALGFYQESKAEKALESLRAYVKEKARVTRGGLEKEIDAKELVPGDIVNLAAGDRVPADGRLIFSDNLFSDESILTGEALPVEKHSEPVTFQAALADRRSMVFSGTLITEGRGTAVISATGGLSQIGAIASLVGEIKEEATPLQRAIGSFAARMTIGLIILSFLVFLGGVAAGYSAFDMFLMGVAIAVAAVPEGLPIALTVILAVGVERLAAKKGIVRKLLSAETLGNVSVILTDKTGTLTQAKMELINVAIPFLEQNGKRHRELQEFILKAAILDGNAAVENPAVAPAEWQIVGRALEKALIKGAALKFKIFQSLLLKEAVVGDRLAFSSETKYSAAVAKIGKRNFVLMMGAPEIVLGASYFLYWNGEWFSKDRKKAALQEIDEAAYRGERILAVAVREIASGDDVVLKNLGKTGGMSFLGTVSFKDPVRIGLDKALREIENAGVKTVIVTGDHRGTAEAVAKELGMAVGEGSVIDQRDLDLMSDEALKARLPAIRIFSRVTPLAKVRIAAAYQNAGETVAMTGDGVNDAPALKQADIGVGLGSGTDAAKGAADIVLLDDNFETIVAAIGEGRQIFQNIRKVIVFLLTDLLDELIIIGGSLIAGVALPLSALQILWVNFFTDSFPAVALAFEKDGSLSQKRARRSSLFDSQMKFLIWVMGILTSVFLLVLYLWLLRAGFHEALVRSFLFASFGTYTLFLIFSVRRLDTSIFNYNPFSNKYANAGALFGMILMAIAVYLPFFQNLFGTVSLPLVWLLGVFAVGFASIAAVEFGKWLFIRKT
ncbi:MAG: HAD-IC family P-type ATPase [Parcubacteria group bacterium]|nr:HAD-IC family P-type ATPase [Parcubacteria group bacterium]